MDTYETLAYRNCSGVWRCRAIVLFDRVGSGADERDSNGDERVVSERGHGPQVAGDSRLGLAIWLASLIGSGRKWGRARASNGRDSSASAAEPAVARSPKAEGSCDGAYLVVLRLLSETGEQRVPAVANQQPLADLLQAIRVSDPV